MLFSAHLNFQDSSLCKMEVAWVVHLSLFLCIFQGSALCPLALLWMLQHTSGIIIPLCSNVQTHSQTSSADRNGFLKEFMTLVMSLNIECKQDLLYTYKLCLLIQEEYYKLHFVNVLQERSIFQLLDQESFCLKFTGESSTYNIKDKQQTSSDKAFSSLSLFPHSRTLRIL